MRHRNSNLSETNPFHRFDHLVGMDRRSNDLRWQLAVADANARKWKRASVKDDSLMNENQEVKNLESSSSRTQLEAKCDTLSGKLSLAKFEKSLLEIKIQNLEDEIVQLGRSRAYLLLSIQNHSTPVEAEEPEKDVDLSDEIARYHRLLEKGEKRLSQFSSSPPRLLEEKLFCGFEGVPLCSVRGVTQGLRKLGVGSKHICQIL